MTSETVTSEMIDALNQMGSPWMIVGSFSTNYYGIPRSTKDADFVLRLEGKSIRELVSLLGADFQLDPQAAFETVTATVRYRIGHPSSDFQIEVFLLSDDAHDQSRFARRVSVSMFGRAAFIPTAEDCVVTKLRWLRDAGRGKDEDDIRNLLSVQQDRIDWDYLLSWCERHGTREILDRIRASLPAS